MNSDPICVCEFHEKQMESNVLSVAAAVMQLMLYPKFLSLLGRSTSNDSYSTAKIFTKSFIMIMLIISFAIIAYGSMLTIRGTKENIALRKAYCDNKPIARKSEEKACDNIAKNQSIFNYVNIFNNFVGIVMFFVIMVFLFRAPNMTDKLTYIFYTFVFLALSIGSALMKSNIISKI